MVELLAMTKSEAIKIFSSVASLAGALGISRQAVYKWPNDLPQEQVDRIVGAAIRTGRIDPCAMQPLPNPRAAGQEAA